MSPVHVALPNFIFNATMTFVILRHDGVELGKMDCVSSMPAQG